MRGDFESPIAERPEAPSVRPVDAPAADREERERRIRRSRSERAERRRKQKRANAALIAALVVASAALVAIAVWKFGPDPGGRRPGDLTDSVVPGAMAVPSTATVTIASGTSASDAFANTFDPNVEPTPVFASYRSLRLNLPVPYTALTAIAYHQASSEKALAMTSLLPNADMSKAIKLKTSAKYVFSTDASGTSLPDGIPSVLKGEVLRLWRSHRTGATDRCADVGAKPGTAVFAPVTGTVLLVRPYDLYGKYTDYELHIKPDGWPEIDCVLIHIDKVGVKPGDRVIGGATQVAQVRLLSDRVPHQLGEYVAGGGDHTHLQLNKLAVPGKIEIEGKLYDVSKPGETITVTAAPPKAP
ncbi:MAG: M23 family metallopeptidase [Actinobacteria bacterium]|nr:MAG: M23 family metallopeptidase [Actinomycetota bacterium]